MSPKQQFLLAVKAAIEQQFMAATGHFPLLRLELTQPGHETEEVRAVFAEGDGAVLSIGLPREWSFQFYPKPPSSPPPPGKGKSTFACPHCGQSITAS